MKKIGGFVCMSVVVLYILIDLWMHLVDVELGMAITIGVLYAVGIVLYGVGIGEEYLNVEQIVNYVKDIWRKS